MSRSRRTPALTPTTPSDERRCSPAYAYKPSGMGAGEADDQNEPGREHWNEAVSVTETYETSEDFLVMYDCRNPLAWIESSYFGIPIDNLEQVEREKDADADQGGT
ncbi:DUF7331 family protein [Natronosalvus rutilus]|uniref:Uncharacterized protein n=1 Tax=Natronosalvus rutilus TaxID=2953753 RepID=A0A9E7NFR4_9EURY|nr:hypothetical protein [Natronosalvus rutilus]UTF55998.1 hypothetical protein NGM29_20640 [Natronosalvus rutilus]